MMIKHVLACIDGTAGDQAVLDYTWQMAQRFPLHIAALHVHFDIHSIARASWYARRVDRMFGLTEAVDRLADEAAKQAYQHFNDWHSRNKLPLIEDAIPVRASSTAWHDIKGHEMEVIAGKGRCTDLTIVARPASGCSSLVLETAMFETGRPVLIVPEGPAPDLFHRPIIAWNGSTEVAQAVGRAIPLLADFQRPVEIVTTLKASTIPILGSCKDT